MVSDDQELTWMIGRNLCWISLGKDRTNIPFILVMMRTGMQMKMNYCWRKIVEDDQFHSQAIYWPTITINKDEYRQWWEPWWWVLILKFWGSRRASGFWIRRLRTYGNWEIIVGWWIWTNDISLSVLFQGGLP